ALVFSGLIVWVAEVARREEFGLLRVAELDGLLPVVLGFGILDVWTYWWHRLNHRVPFLWRFHRMHHSDPAVDVTTATRFHVGEILLSSLMRVALIPLFGIPIESVIAFDVIQLPLIAFHHANISLPERADRALCWFVVTPFMHKVHHSRRKQETDSNYSSVLSVWDRVFRSFVQIDDHRTIRFGLDGFDDERHQSLTGLLKTPLIEESRRKE
ncbi:MAG: sterol desaturase family protein, partial [Ignavibacteria bacterium]|nr:sterol desaturase family protein [Ignavibacteria bacterium]